MNEYILTFTEETEAPFSLYLRVSEYVAATFAQALKADNGFSDVTLVRNEVTATPVTGKPTKRATTDKGSATKDKSA